MKEANTTEKICPKCGQAYTVHSAISRIDNSEICPDCGTREALDSIGVSPEEQNEILNIIHGGV